MADFVLSLTDAGLAAVRAASGTSKTVIATLGLTNTPFVPAPTLTALPGQFKQIAILSGVAPAPNVIHLTAYDQSAEVWDATGFGLFLDDGTLFGAYSGEETVLSKAGLAFALMAFDIAINADLVANIDFGDTNFVWPPATEETRGIARLATQGEVDEGAEGQTIVTPRTLGNRLAAMAAAINAAITASVNALTASIAALTARKISAGGLATGGGDLSADRTITVTEASAAEITAGTAADKVVTPRRLGPISMSLTQNGYIRFFGFQMAWGRFNAAANDSTAVAFAQPFPTACFSVVASGGVSGGPDSKDNPPVVIASTITKDGFSVFSADDSNDVTCFIAVGW
ncbi:hypothetical protein [Sphingomonas sp. IC081]|uniref:gp53-like domain-containing protein n=1 Tax=Sphingomonas sp. IC081 TaxID=304378 RepID=UPI00115BA7F5|nr:hypothetical protein [Sphingomonas sp. IC081]QDK34537.1 hypothetical protein DM450_17505 [Sphingomonas sp. IC081]